MEKTVKEIIDALQRIEGLKAYALIGGLAIHYTTVSKVIQIREGDSEK
jgi:hypothetical protein